MRQSATAALVSLAMLPALSCGEPSEKPGNGPDDRPDSRELVRRMLEIFHDRASVASLGRKYLKQTPAESTAEVLASSLTQGWSSAERARPTAELHAALRQQLRADFAAGRTVRLGGWILGQTELRLAALAALSLSV